MEQFGYTSRIHQLYIHLPLEGFMEGFLLNHLTLLLGTGINQNTYIIWVDFVNTLRTVFTTLHMCQKYQEVQLLPHYAPHLVGRAGTGLAPQPCQTQASGAQGTKRQGGLVRSQSCPLCQAAQP